MHFQITVLCSFFPVGKLGNSYNVSSIVLFEGELEIPRKPGFTYHCMDAFLWLDQCGQERMELMKYTRVDLHIYFAALMRPFIRLFIANISYLLGQYKYTGLAFKIIIIYLFWCSIGFLCMDLTHWINHCLLMDLSIISSPFPLLLLWIMQAWIFLHSLMTCAGASGQYVQRKLLNEEAHASETFARYWQGKKEEVI